MTKTKTTTTNPAPGTPGRASLHKSGAMSKAISVHFNDAQAAAVQAAARREGVSPDQYMRDATIAKVCPQHSTPTESTKWHGTFEAQRRPVRFPDAVFRAIMAHSAKTKVPRAVIVREATLARAGKSELGAAGMLR